MQIHAFWFNDNKNECKLKTQREKMKCIKGFVENVWIKEK